MRLNLVGNLDSRGYCPFIFIGGCLCQTSRPPQPAISLPNHQWSGEIQKEMPRQYERIEFRAQIALQCVSGKHEAYIGDLSVTGCYIDTRIALSRGEPVWFELDRPDGGRLPFAGIVAHSMPGVGFGVKFANLNLDQLRFIEIILRGQEVQGGQICSETSLTVEDEVISLT